MAIRHTRTYMHGCTRSRVHPHVHVRAGMRICVCMRMHRQAGGHGRTGRHKQGHRHAQAYMRQAHGLICLCMPACALMCENVREVDVCDAFVRRMISRVRTRVALYSRVRRRMKCHFYVCQVADVRVALVRLLLSDPFGYRDEVRAR